MIGLRCSTTPWTTTLRKGDALVGETLDRKPAAPHRVSLWFARNLGGMSDPPDPDARSVQRCDYCRLPLPSTQVTEDYQGIIYTFCCEACQTAMAEHERTFTEYHGFRRFESGVTALDSALPQGIPRNSFVLLSSHAGTRTEALTAEVVWRTLERGEDATFLTFLEPPVSVVQQFARLDWNILPYLESGRLEIVDCFTYRLEDRDRMHERMNDWNRHINTIAEPATSTVQDPTDIRAIESHLDRSLSDRDIHDSGVVVIDSLTEVGSLVQPVQAYNFVKDLRADICKGRFVPVFAAATVTEGRDEFPHDLDYMVDGVIELQLNDELVDSGLVKQIRARKMSGVLTLPSWVGYEYTRGEGLVPLEEEPESSSEDEDAGNVMKEAAMAAVKAAIEGDEGQEPQQDATEAEPDQPPGSPDDAAAGKRDDAEADEGSPASGSNGT